MRLYPQNHKLNPKSRIQVSQLTKECRSSNQTLERAPVEQTKRKVELVPLFKTLASTCGTLRRLLLLVSPVKSTADLVQFLWLCRTKPRSGLLQRQ
jgi:hypothetical protein